jgi:hypothetical protein
MENLLVYGRHMSKFARFDPKNITSSFSVYEDSVTLRLDDTENPEWWLEVDIPKERLKSLLGDADF